MSTYDANYYGCYKTNSLHMRDKKNMQHLICETLVFGRLCL